MANADQKPINCRVAFVLDYALRADLGASCSENATIKLRHDRKRALVS